MTDEHSTPMRVIYRMRLKVLSCRAEYEFIGPTTKNSDGTINSPVGVPIGYRITFYPGHLAIVLPDHIDPGTEFETTWSPLL